MYIIPFENHELHNYIDKQCYILQPAIHVEVTHALQQQLVLICNEPKIYSVLFAKNLHNKPYTIKMANAFFYWATNGWKTKEYFVFFVTTLHQELVSCIDIKSADLHIAEIGYWSSENHSGHMTAAVKMLCNVAKFSGFRKLNARVGSDNTRSIKLLKRTGFVCRGHSSGRQLYDVYSRDLI